VLGTPWIYKIGWEPLIDGEFKVINDGKVLSIPLSIHKSNRTANGFNIEKNNTCTSFGIKKT